MNIRQTFKGEGLFLIFGVMMALSSSFGQTFFLGVYKGSIRSAYGLSEADFGLMYFGLTVVGAVLLNRLGHLIDTVPLQKYTLALAGLMVLSCFFVAVSPGLWTVFLALLMVRFVGQGLMTHAAMTSMTRYFNKRRGLAVSVASLGMPIGQSILPPLAVFLIAYVGWQSSWAVFGLVCLCILAPVALYCLKGHEVRHSKWLSLEKGSAAGQQGGAIRQWRKHEVIRDKRLGLIFLVSLACPFWITAVFFFAENMALMKGWSLQAFTSLYWMNAVGAVTIPVVGGLIVDRVGGLRSMALYPPLLSLSLLLLIVGDNALMIGLGLAFLGIAGGLSIPVNTTIWAELYGTRYLGEIKSLSTSVMVFSTALAPYLIGALLDQGVSLESILWVGVCHGVFATFVAFWLKRYANP